ncbi:phage tail protein [Streptomyces anulatus]|uniref:phage tail protein n=1 Tax=Streptomyces anulatus TaxID=1892 RepID=UPI003418D7FA
MAVGDEEDYGSAVVRIDLDDSEAVTDARDLGLRIARALDRATRDAGDTIRANVQRGLDAVAVGVTVEPDLSRLDAQVSGHTLPELPLTLVPDLGAVDRAVRGHKLPELPLTLVPDLDAVSRAVRGHKLPELPLTLVPDLDAVTRAVRGLKLPQLALDLIPDVTTFMTRLRALLAGEEVTIRVVPDLDTFDARIRAHRAPDITVNVDADTSRFGRAMSGLSGIAGKVGKGLLLLLKFGAIGIAAAAATQGVVGLIAALAPAAGIIAALPAAIAVVQVALGTMKLALNGVSEALSAAVSGSAAEFEKSLQGLAPAAQKAVTAVRAFQPELKALQQAVQQSFFKQFSGDVTGALKNLLPLGSGLSKVAAEFGKAASEGLKFAATSQASTPLKAIIDGTAQAASGLQKAVVPLAKGFLDVAAAVTKAFAPNVGSGIAAAGARVGEFLSRFAESGRAVEVVRAALTVLQQIGAIASNVGGILSGVFNAANAAGGGLLNNLKTITASFEAFVKSAQGQEAIGAIFGTIATIAAQLGPILGALVTQVGAIAPALAPVFATLGPALVQVINALGPALATIAPALATVGTALSAGLSALTSNGALDAVGSVVAGLLTALAPLLPLVGALANTVLSVLAPAFETVIAALSPVIAALVGALLPALGPITTAFSAVVTAVLPLGVALGQVLGSVITSLAPILLSLSVAVAQVASSFIPLVQAIIAALLPILPPLIAAFQAVLGAIIPLLAPITGLLAAVAPLAAKIVELIAPLLQFTAVVIKAVAINVLVPIISRIVSTLTRMITTLTTVITAVTSFVDGVIGLFTRLYNILVGNSIIPDLINAIIRFFTSLPGKILGSIRGLISSVTGVFRSMASSALSAISSFVSRAISFLRGLPAKAVAALSGAKSALVSAGADLIRGLISGIKSMAGSLVSAAKGTVKGAVDGAKSLLGISSPSRVFRDIGKDTGLGFIIGFTGTAAQIRAAVLRVTEGVIKIGRQIGVGFIKSLTGTSSQIKSATSKLATDIAATFRGVKTTVDDRLIKLVQVSNQRLQALAVQRDAITKKLADAQKFAADTTAATLSAFSLTNITQGLGQQSTDAVVSGLRSAILQVKNFTKQVDALAARGLNSTLLEQVIGLGPEKGAELAKALSTADKGTLARINNLQAQLVDASQRLGRTGADALYDSGKAAADGFLAGIKGQQKAIEKLMIDIAKGMQRAIREALDIRSPSHVFRRIGDMTGQGLHLGLLSRFAVLQEAARSAARGVVKTVGTEFSRMPDLAGAMPAEVAIPLTRAQRAQQRAEQAPGRSGQGAGRGGRGAGGGGAGTTVQNITINEVGNARATAHRVANRLAGAGVGL